MVQDCFMATLDLKDAYFLIPIVKTQRKFLRFTFDGCLYEFTCMPFGLCVAPFVFTKLLKPVLAYLRSQGVSSSVYLDDFLLFGSDRMACLANVHATYNVLATLGFVLNTEKSMLIPQQRCKYLGFVYDSTSMTLRLPADKQQKLLVTLESFRVRHQCAIREFKIHRSACFRESCNQVRLVVHQRL